MPLPAPDPTLPLLPDAAKPATPQPAVMDEELATLCRSLDLPPPEPSCKCLCVGKR